MEPGEDSWCVVDPPWRTTGKISIEPPIERSSCVEAKASQILQLGIAE